MLSDLERGDERPKLRRRSLALRRGSMRALRVPNRPSIFGELAKSRGRRRSSRASASARRTPIFSWFRPVRRHQHPRDLKAELVALPKTSF